MFLKFSKFFLYVSLFSVLIVAANTFFPFIGVKYYFFRIAVELALVFFVLWGAFEGGAGEIKERFFKISRHPLFIAVSAFVFFYLLASVFAYDPIAAFWSNYERGEGSFQMLHYYLFFVLLISLFKNKRDWQLAFRFSLGVAGLMILYGIFAQLGWVSSFISPYRGSPPDGFWHRLVDARFHATLGNPSYVAPYLMFTIFYAGYLWLSRNWKNKYYQGLAYGSLIFIFLFFFSLSRTRGTIIGLFVALLVFLGYLIFAGRARIKKWGAIILGVILVVSAFGWVYRDTSLVKSLPGGRVFEINFNNRDVETRFWTWGSAWEGFKDRPILGWGQENFGLVFDLNFNPNHYLPNAESETWFDRAHSIVFDSLAETGILGFLSYVSIFVIFYWLIIKKYLIERKEKFESGELSPLASTILTGMILAIPVGYLVQGLFLFDVLPIYLNLFLFLAFTYFQFSQLSDNKNSAK